MIGLPLLLHLISLLYPALASLPAPVNITVISVNFHHVLRWDPGPSTPPGTHYKIFKRQSGKKQTQQINSTTTSCQLKLLRDRRYYLTVQASYNNTLSPVAREVLFSPSTDTTIDPPKLSLAGCGNCIQVNISLPKADRFPETDDIQSFYSSNFRVFWKKKEEDRAVEHMEIQNKSFTLRNLKSGVEYCVQVQVKISMNKNTKPSAWTCSFTSLVEPRRGPFLVGAVTALLIFLFIILTIGGFFLYHVGFLCKLKTAVPRALITTLIQGYTLTPERIFPDQIFISSEMGKQRMHNNPTTSPLATRGANSEMEDNDEEEDDSINVYLDRDAELASGESSRQDCGDMSDNSKPAASGDSGSLIVRTAEVEVAKFDQAEAKAKEAEVSFIHKENQTGVRGQVTGKVEEEEMQEVEEEMLDISGRNVNLFSVTLAALAVGDEEEEEQSIKDFFTDFLKVSSLERLPTPDSKWTLSETDLQTVSDDQTPVAPMQPSYEDFTVTGNEGRHADTSMEHKETEEEEEEEEEEEDSSGYLAHR